MNEIELDDGWELSTDPAGPWLPARVPGNWYLDGIGHEPAGADPPAPETVWYRRTVELPPEWADHEVRLRVGAADYRATVSWDGSELASHTGGFAPFTVVVPADPGPHEVAIRVDCPTDPFGSVWPHSKTTIRGIMGHHDARPGNWTERGQERSTGGIWGRVRLTAHREASIEAIRVATPLRGADAELHLVARIELAHPTPRWARVTARLIENAGDGVTAYELWSDTWLEPGDNDVHVRGPLAAPRLWWTWDQGEPHRYRLDTEVLLADDKDAPLLALASDSRLVGIRSIEVGDDWVWRLNGRPVFIRGMNHIGEHWLSAMTEERAAADVRLATDANLNLLRIHAHVTAPAVYDACDEAGVLVWQDLPLQWGYADSAETYRVTRRMVHEIIDLHGWRPSVAYWCAHNEAPWNEPWMADEAGRFAPDQNQRLDHELADLFRRLDPSRPALANSGAGDGHTYPGWYWGDWDVASEIPGGAFPSEYGAQGVPDLETLRTFLPETATADDWTYHGFQHHEHAQKVGVNLFTHSVPELIEASQRYQARQLQFATEHYRRRKRERVQGVIPFMLVDPWPCISWSVVDHLRHPKLGYHALARAMQPVLPSIEAADDTYPGDDPFEPEPVVFGIWWINDLHRTFPAASLSWRLVDPRGAELASVSTTTDVLADAARRVLQAGPFDLAPGRYALETTISDRSGAVLGSNRWDFVVTEPPSLPEGLA